MLLFCFIIISVFAATQKPLGQPILHSYTDKPQKFILSPTQSARIPLGRAISDTFAVIGDQVECEIQRKEITFKELNTSKYPQKDQPMPVSTILLNKKHSLITIDNNFRIRAYNISKNNLKQFEDSYYVQVDRKQRGSPTLVASPDQQQIYILNGNSSIHFFTDFLRSSVTRLTVHMPHQIKKAIVIDKQMYIASQKGIQHYQRLSNFNLKLIDSNPNLTAEFMAADMHYDPDRSLLFVLSEKQYIHVFNISMHGDNKTVEYSWQLVDSLDISNITGKNQRLKVQNQTILVMFEHINRHVIAQINYNLPAQTFAFVRYYKFNHQLTDMELFNKQLIVMSKGSMTTFTVGIHPNMITDVANLTNHSHIIHGFVFQRTYFIGIYSDKITLFKMIPKSYSQLVCHIKSGPVNEIVYMANMSECGYRNRKLKQSIKEYCQYRKTISFFLSVEKNGMARLQQLMVGICLLMLFIVCMMLVALIYKRMRINRMKLMDDTDVVMMLPEANEMVALPTETNRMNIQTDNRLVWKPPVPNN